MYKMSEKTLTNNMYLIAFGIYIVTSVFKTTMFTVPNMLYVFLNIIALSIILFKIVFLDNHSEKQIILYAFILFCAIAIYLYSRYNVIDLTIILMGSKNIQLSKAVKIYFFITFFILIITIIAAKIGIVENLQYYRTDGTLRQSFGIVYTTDFSAHIFYLILAYCYIKKKIGWLDALIFVSLGMFVLEYCDARLDAISIFLTSAFFLYIRFRSKTKLGIISRKLLIVSLPICIIISIGLTMIYNNNSYNSNLNSLDSALSGRLFYGAKGISMYGFSTFGQKIDMQGSGGTTEKVDNYFFIDCSYLQIALRNGVIFLLVVCLLFVYSCKKYIENGNIKIPLILALIAINSMVAHHFLDLAYNPFLLMILAPIEKDIYITFSKHESLEFKRKIIGKNEELSV